MRGEGGRQCATQTERAAFPVLRILTWSPGGSEPLSPDLPPLANQLQLGVQAPPEIRANREESQGSIVAGVPPSATASTLKTILGISEWSCPWASGLGRRWLRAVVLRPKKKPKPRLGRAIEGELRSW